MIVFLGVFESLTPKSTENNDKFDVAFPVAILGRLAGKNKKIRELPFFEIVHESAMEQSDKCGQTNFQKNYASFSESDCVFTIKAFICENTIKKYLASLDFTDKSISDDKLNDIRNKVNNILADTETKGSDWIYWKMFRDNDLFKLLVGVCYLPSKYAHPDCWILTQIKDGPLTRGNCGFISFAYKLHRDAMAIEQANVKNTYQSSMEYVYSKKKGKGEINSTKYLQCASLFDLRTNTGEKLLDFSSDTDRKNKKSASSLPNLPIAASLSYDKEKGIYEVVHKHAIQITSSNIDEIFPNCYKIIFPHGNMNNNENESSANTLKNDEKKEETNTVLKQ